MTNYARFLSALALGALTACNAVTTGTSTAPITTVPPNPTLQLAVGTLNNAYGLLGTPGVYLNAMTTFRSPSGAAAFPSPGNAQLTGPGALNANVGGLYAYGQAAGVNFTLGEPPAFAPQNLNGGFSTGYIITYAPVTSGSYSVQTSVSADGVTHTYTASAMLPATPTVLPDEPLPAWTSDGKGGGTFAMTNPTGVTESLIFVQATNGQYITTVELKSPATSVKVPDGTLTVGTTYYEFCIGADFPLVESAGPNSTSAKPPIASSGGTADITASSATTFTE